MSQAKFLQLREQYPRFLYRGFEISALAQDSESVSFHFEIPGLTQFSSEFHFPKTDVPLSSLSPLLSRLGLIEALSYWKTTCSPVLEVPENTIGTAEVPFWKEVYYQGLGEFRYQNEIETTQETFVELEGVSGETLKKLEISPGSGNLIPVGGGKDSIVTLELLSKEKRQNHLFYLNPREACIRTGEIAGYSADSITVVNRSLDNALFRLNKEGFLNGHTPYSALLAFTSLVVAALEKKQFIILSNENSASEGNVDGEEVNHQYSKSLHFEELFREYSKDFITDASEYFSLLRPLHEVQIGKLFAQHPKYFSAFRSCNVGCYEDRWCCECSKCLFTALLLAPFLSAPELETIFPVNPLNNTALRELLLDLCIAGRVKPFECIGTREESKALVTSLLKTEAPYPLIQAVRSDVSGGTSLDTLKGEWNSEHHLPSHFEKLLKEALDA